MGDKTITFMTNVQALDKIMDVMDYVAFQLEGDKHQRFAIYEDLRETYTDIGKLNGGITQIINPPPKPDEPPKMVKRTVKTPKRKGRFNKVRENKVRLQLSLMKKIATEVPANPWLDAQTAPYDETLEWVTATGLVRVGRRSKAKNPFPNGTVYAYRVPAPGTFRGKYWRKRTT